MASWESSRRNDTSSLFRLIFSLFQLIFFWAYNRTTRTDQVAWPCAPSAFERSGSSRQNGTSEHELHGAVWVELALFQETAQETLKSPLAERRSGEQIMPIVRGKNVEVLFPAETIAQRNCQLAKQIAGREFHDLLVISILKGSFIFAADLIRCLHDAGLAPEVEFILISSYGAGTQSRAVKILRDIEAAVEGRDVLIIDDILESGNTLKSTRDLVLSRGARSVSIAVLLDKRGRRQLDIEAQFVGFPCPDRFVVGYGMDAAHCFRELPFIGAVTEEASS